MKRIIKKRFIIICSLIVMTTFFSHYIIVANASNNGENGEGRKECVWPEESEIIENKEEVGNIQLLPQEIIDEENVVNNNGGVWTGYTTEESSVNNLPEGELDIVTAGQGSVYVKGWAFDRDELSASVKIQVFVGTQDGLWFVANTYRADVNEIYPGVGVSHGFEETCVLKTRGESKIRVYAVDVQDSEKRVLLGEKIVTIETVPYSVTAEMETVNMAVGDIVDIPISYAGDGVTKMHGEISDSTVIKTVAWNIISSKKTSVLKIEALAVGTSTFTVNLLNENGKLYSKDITITVTQPVTGITIQAENKTMYIGETQTMQSILVPVTATNTAVSWSSSDTNVATVDENGLVSAVGCGTVYIVATTQDGSNLQATYTLRVVNADVPFKPYKIVNVVSGVHVYWKTVDGVHQYGLWRSESENGSYKWIANPTTVHFTDTTVQSGKTYFYRVTSYDGESMSHSEKSDAIAITYVSTPDIIVRMNLAAGVKLTWNESVGATGYAIYRKAYNGSTWIRVTTIRDNNTFSWTDTSVMNNNGTMYRYTIRALAEDDCSTLSGCRSTGRTMVRLTSRKLNSVVKTGLGSVKCTWTTTTQASGYEVRFMVGSTVYKQFTIGNYKTGAKTFNGLASGQTYKVQVRSYRKVDGVGGFYSAWSVPVYVNL